MKKLQSAGRALLGLGGLCLLSFNCYGFALLGPYEPWMQQSNSFRLPGDIGGPMPMGCEYRWNVPVLTYGFDKSFMEFFGTNGVAAVEAAIQLFNDLPPASQIDLADYSTNSRWINVEASTQGLYDLKSMTLPLLIEQLGLAPPAQSIFVLRKWDQYLASFPDELWWDDYIFETYLGQRNFDPESLLPSRYVNSALYTGFFWNGPGRADIIEMIVDPLQVGWTAVAEKSGLTPGEFIYTLTQDDVGGLRFLLDSNNVNFEFLLPDTRGRGTNAESWVTGAWRAGVEKITFIPHTYYTSVWNWQTMTNPFTDRYVTNGSMVEQELERVIATPDFVFTATNTGLGAPYTSHWLATDSSAWENRALENGSTNGGGPGTIVPPVKMTFHKLGDSCITGTVFPDEVRKLAWGWFSFSTNPFFTFPASPVQDQTNFAINVQLINDWTSSRQQFTWQLPVALEETAILQSSSNLVDWTSLLTVTNRGAVIDWYPARNKAQEYFRALPQ